MIVMITRVVITAGYVINTLDAFTIHKEHKTLIFIRNANKKLKILFGVNFFLKKDDLKSRKRLF